MLLRSIGVGDTLGVAGGVEDCGVGTDFDGAGVLLVEVVGPFGVGELDQVLEDVVGAGVERLVVLLVAGVVFVVLQVAEAAVGVEVVVGAALLEVDLVALEPLLEPHGAHDVVVGHRVEGVEGALDALLGHQAHLPGSGRPVRALPVVVEHFRVFEAPGLEDD